MKKFAVKFASLPLLLLLLLLWFDRCHSQTCVSQFDPFFPFGSDEGDSVVRIGWRTCDEVNISHPIYGQNALYVSSFHL